MMLVITDASWAGWKETWIGRILGCFMSLVDKAFDKRG